MNLLFYLSEFFCRAVVIGTKPKLIISAKKPNIIVGHPKGLNGTARGLKFEGTPVDVGNVVAKFIRKADNKYLIQFQDNNQFLCGHYKPKSPSVIMCNKEIDPHTLWTVEQGPNNNYALKTKGGKCLRMVNLDKRKKSRGFYLHIKPCKNKDFSWNIEKYSAPQESDSSDEEEASATEPKEETAEKESPAEEDLKEPAKPNPPNQMMKGQIPEMKDIKATGDDSMKGSDSSDSSDAEKSATSNKRGAWDIVCSMRRRNDSPFVNGLLKAFEGPTRI